MKFVLKVEGVEHNSQLITIDTKKNQLIDNIDDFIKNKDSLAIYHGREVFAEYLGKSRIDGEPMFRIDTLQLEREDKISEILK